MSICIMMCHVVRLSATAIRLLQYYKLGEDFDAQTMSVVLTEHSAYEIN